MKIFTSILILIAFALIIFNITMIDFSKPFEGDSLVAIIGIVASLCAVFILLIFKMSKKIDCKMDPRLKKLINLILINNQSIQSL